MSLFKVLLITVVSLFMFSCSADYYLQRGNKMYETGRYYKSCDYYKEAYSKIRSKEAKAEIAKKIGEANNKINRLREASIWYRKSLRYDENNKELIYSIIEAAHKRGDAKLIEKYLKYYEALVKDNPKVLKDYMNNFSNSDNRYLFNKFKNLNSVGNDFSPAYAVGDTNVVYFTSTRRISSGKGFLNKILRLNEKKDGVTGTYYSNIYIIEFTDIFNYKDKKGKNKTRQLKKPKWMKARMLCDSTINSRLNEGAICFSSDGNIMYFTSSRKVGNSNYGTKIYTGELKNDLWGNVKMLSIVPDSVSVGHPALSPDGSKLYFVSDMNRGQGGKDIWYCEKNGDKWGEPINAGRKINTKGDEMYPYFRDNGQLYFSSNGHSGFGGLDIFKVCSANGEKSIDNIGYPFNSEADDFGIVYKKGLDEGLFSSSRGKRGVDNIYKFKYITYRNNLTIRTENVITGEFVPNVRIKMISSEGDEKDISSGDKGEVNVDLGEKEEYLFVLYKDGYLKEKFVIKTEGLQVSNNIEKLVALKPIEQSIELPNILYDFGKWELNEESKESLDELINILNTNPNIVIELSSHTDMVGSDSDNLSLSYKRAAVVVNYLIEKGIYWDRLIAKGYGENKPKEISLKDEKKYGFLKKGKLLTKDYIFSLDSINRIYANKLNRRTEFKVLRTDYKEGKDSKNPQLRKKYMERFTKKGYSALKNDVKKNNTLLVKDIRKIKGLVFTLQLGFFNRNKIPEKYNVLKVVFFNMLGKNGKCRLTHGIFDSYKQAKIYEKKVKAMGFDCFITAYKDGNIIDLKEAIKLAEKSN